LAEYMDDKLTISDAHTDMLVAELKGIEQRLPK
jgi:NAD-dependent DNA ligase